MKTYSMIFTADEIAALHNAAIEEKHRLLDGAKINNMAHLSEGRQQRIKLLDGLKWSLGKLSSANGG